MTVSLRVLCAADGDGRRAALPGSVTLSAAGGKKRGRLGRLFRTLKINRHHNFPKLGRTKVGWAVPAGCLVSARVTLNRYIAAGQRGLQALFSV